MVNKTSFDPHAIAGEIRRKAVELGFDLVGIAPAAPSAYADFFRQWLADGRHGDMQWLARRVQERTDPAVYFPGAKSVICVAVNYHVPLAAEPPVRSTGFSRSSQQDRLKAVLRTGRVARYALGDDYHEWFKPRLHALADWLKETVPGTETRCAVDTAPVMEKELAARAGVGWTGKNTCAINEKIGSWIFLGEMLTTLALPLDNPAIDRCGTCTRCLDACPTHALGPYRIDARRCISYLNIELRGDVPAEFWAAMGDWLFGCDICQEVCPWNHKAPLATVEAFQPRWPTGRLDATAVSQWTTDDYRRELKGSAMKRVKLNVLQRNAGIVLRNCESGDRSSVIGEQ
ncbi:MAG: tRNA epoxyqueuosine(34) reductase QueG [Tepidisphaerales bacterium]